MRCFVALVLGCLVGLAADAGAAPRKTPSAPASAGDAEALKGLRQAADLPPLLLPAPDPPPARPEPRLGGTAGRSLDLGEIRMTPGGFVGVDLQRSGR